MCFSPFLFFFLMPYQFVLSNHRILFHRRRWFRYSAAKSGRARSHVSLCRCRRMWTRRVERRGKRHGNLFVNESDQVPAVYLAGQSQLRLVRFGVLPFGRSEYVPRVSSLDPSLSFQILRRSRATGESRFPANAIDFVCNICVSIGDETSRTRKITSFVHD